MILDGNSRVGHAKVYASQKEMDQEKEIQKRDAEIECLYEAIQYAKRLMYGDD